VEGIWLVCFDFHISAIMNCHLGILGHIARFSDCASAEAV